MSTKTVYSYGLKVAYLWAAQSQCMARAGNVSFRDTGFYSYKTCIARHLGRGWICINKSFFSRSTSRHQFWAQSAVRHLRSITLEDTRWGGPFDLAPSVIADHKARSITKALPQALRSLSAGPLRSLMDEQSKLSEFCQDFELQARPFPLSSEQVQTELDKLRQRGCRKEQRLRMRRLRLRVNAALRRAAEFGIVVPAGIELDAQRGEEQVPPGLVELENKLDGERQRRAAIELAGELEAWRNGARASDGLLSAPVALRLNHDERGRLVVETSQGASVLLCQARRLFRLCQAVRTRGEAFPRANPYLEEKGPQVGPFALRGIDKLGNARVGCHDLPFEEMERLYLSLTTEQLKQSETAQEVAHV